MDRTALVEALSTYRRPGTPVYAYHFRKLPREVLKRENATKLRAILRDTSLPMRVREHAAGALGELRDRRAVGQLIEALGNSGLRRGAAVALGLIGDRRAVPALEAAADGCKAARWAVGQFDRPQTTGDLIDDLGRGHLHEIGRKLKLDSVTATQRLAVEQVALMELREAVAAGRLGQEHRWLMNALEGSRLPGVDVVLSEALHLAVNNRDTCPTVRGRLVRVIDARRAVAAIPALVDLACLTDQPGQAHLAIASLRKVLKQRPESGPLLAAARSRLQRQLAEFRRVRSETPPRPPPRVWERTPGSPGWYGAVDRAIKALDRLLAECS